MKEAFTLASKTIDGPMRGPPQSWSRDRVSIPKHMFRSIVIITDGRPNVRVSDYRQVRYNAAEVLELTRSKMKDTKVNVTCFIRSRVDISYV